MEIVCKKCGNTLDVKPVGTQNSYICKKCGTAVSLIEEIAGKKTTVVDQSKAVQYQGMLKPGDRFGGYRVIELIGS